VIIGPLRSWNLPNYLWLHSLVRERVNTCLNTSPGLYVLVSEVLYEHRDLDFFDLPIPIARTSIILLKLSLWAPFTKLRRGTFIVDHSYDYTFEN
jgi:hypothetical protein